MGEKGRKIILTGDRPTGRLHVGHYVGSLRRRVELQESGAFDDFETAQKHAKYLMTKFARALLYVNKMSQMSTRAWGAVPIQDYHELWWNKSIAEIDKELIKKYGVRGVDRVVFIGHTQELSLEWDGVNMIDSLSRKISIQF